MLVLEKPRSRNRLNAAWSMRSRMELESCLALPWDKGERPSGFFISDIFLLAFGTISYQSYSSYGTIPYLEQNCYPSSLPMIKPKNDQPKNLTRLNRG